MIKEYQLSRTIASSHEEFRVHSSHVSPGSSVSPFSVQRPEVLARSLGHQRTAWPPTVRDAPHGSIRVTPEVHRKNRSQKQINQLLPLSPGWIYLRQQVSIDRAPRKEETDQRCLKHENRREIDRKRITMSPRAGCPSSLDAGLNWWERRFEPIDLLKSTRFWQ